MPRRLVLLATGWVAVNASLFRIIRQVDGANADLMPVETPVYLWPTDSVGPNSGTEGQPPALGNVGGQTNGAAVATGTDESELGTDTALAASPSAPTESGEATAEVSLEDVLDTAAAATTGEMVATTPWPESPTDMATAGTPTVSSAPPTESATEGDGSEVDGAGVGDGESGTDGATLEVMTTPSDPAVASTEDTTFEAIQATDALATDTPAATGEAAVVVSMISPTEGSSTGGVVASAQPQAVPVQNDGASSNIGGIVGGIVAGVAAAAVMVLGVAAVAKKMQVTSPPLLGDPFTGGASANPAFVAAGSQHANPIYNDV